MSFLTQAVFGAVGKAALAPVYSRSHDTAAQDRPQLSEGLRAALTSLLHLMDNIEPKFIPLSPATCTRATVYADAFFLEGEHKASHVPVEARARRHDRWKSGWAGVSSSASARRSGTPTAASLSPSSRSSRPGGPPSTPLGPLPTSWPPSSSPDAYPSSG